jgi:hypothetical protein
MLGALLTCCGCQKQPSEAGSPSTAPAGVATTSSAPAASGPVAGSTTAPATPLTEAQARQLATRVAADGGLSVAPEKWELRKLATQPADRFVLYFKDSAGKATSISFTIAGGEPKVTSDSPSYTGGKKRRGGP